MLWDANATLKPKVTHRVERPPLGAQASAEAIELREPGWREKRLLLPSRPTRILKAALHRRDPLDEVG